jgi:hypothetical protein
MCIICFLKKLYSIRDWGRYSRLLTVYETKPIYWFLLVVLDEIVQATSVGINCWIHRAGERFFSPSRSPRAEGDERSLLGLVTNFARRQAKPRRCPPPPIADGLLRPARASPAQEEGRALPPVRCPCPPARCTRRPPAAAVGRRRATTPACARSCSASASRARRWCSPSRSPAPTAAATRRASSSRRSWCSRRRCWACSHPPSAASCSGPACPCRRSTAARTYLLRGQWTRHDARGGDAVELLAFRPSAWQTRLDKHDQGSLGVALLHCPDTCWTRRERDAAEGLLLIAAPTASPCTCRLLTSANGLETSTRLLASSSNLVQVKG